MSLYTERHGTRCSINKTYTISITMYALLFDCCSRYFEYLAWKYPEICNDGNGICGLDFAKFSDDMEFEIPTLFRYDNIIDKPCIRNNVFSDDVEYDEFDQFALLDLIEFVAQNIHDISSKNYHSFFRHYDMSFATSNEIAKRFIDEINSIFEKVGLLYCLKSNCEIERIEETAVLSENIEKNIKSVKEIGLKELLETAIKKHKSPYPEDQKDAVEKIWDALERLKTYYTELDKKNSANKIILDISNRQDDYTKLFTDEFKALTAIGNDYRIRHHETNKIEIPDIRYYDYLFNRCLSLIATAIQFLE